MSSERSRSSKTTANSSISNTPSSTIGGSSSNSTTTTTTTTTINNVTTVSASVLPIGDPFERVLTTPKELLIQRSASPRRATASPLKSIKSLHQRCLDQLPRITGNESVSLIIY